MHESVGDGRCGGGVVEELAPLLEGKVCGDDCRGALVALVEDMVEQVRSARVEAEASELVAEQEVVARHLLAESLPFAADRWERKASNYLALVHLACGIIAF